MGVRKTGSSEAAVSNAKTAIAIDRSEPDGFQAALICKSGEFISWTVDFGRYCRSDSMSLRMLRSGCSTCTRMPGSRQRYTFSRFGEAGYRLLTARGGISPTLMVGIDRQARRLSSAIAQRRYGVLRARLWLCRDAGQSGGEMSRVELTALFLPHPVMQRRRFILQQRPHHLRRPLSALEDLPAWQVERRVFRMVAGDAAQPMLAQAIDQAADAGPVHGARAHRAGFGGGIECRLSQHVL